MPSGTRSSDQALASALPWADGGVQLLPGETVLAAGRFDLDASLHFSDGGIVLTTRRVIADRPASATQPLDGPGPWTWTIGPRTRLDVQLRELERVQREELSRFNELLARHGIPAVYVAPPKPIA